MKSNNPHAFVSELIQKKIAKTSYLLDDMINKKNPNGYPMSDEMIKEEITLLAFTVSGLLHSVIKLTEQK